MTTTNYVQLALGYLQEFRAKSEISEETLPDEGAPTCTCRLRAVSMKAEELPEVELTPEQMAEIVASY